LALSVAATAGRQYAGYVARQLRRAHRLIGPGGAALRELSVALVGDGRMRELNRRFTGRDQGTDVLAFGLDQDQRGRTICGEVVVCVSQAKRVARRV
jgi:probable rRNA maturation factor